MSLCNVYFLRIQPPLRSTLFPYTTLFRSRSGEPRPDDPHPRGEDRRDRTRHPTATASAGMSCAIPDRKSTRLNSSHVEISYAVFCLKKKKEIISQFTEQSVRFHTALAFIM